MLAKLLLCLHLYIFVLSNHLPALAFGFPSLGFLFGCLESAVLAMGNASSMLTQYDIEEVQDCCNYLLSRQEIVSLYQKFCELDRNAKGYISADEMLAVPEFAMNPLSKRLVEMVDGLNFKDFVIILSAATSKANQQQKAQAIPNTSFERSRLHSRDSYLVFHSIVMVIFIVLSVTCIILYRFSGDVEALVE